MTLNPSNQAKIDPIYINVPSFGDSSNVNSKDDYEIIYDIRLENLVPVTTVAFLPVTCTEYKPILVNFYTDIPEFLLWLQGRVSYLSFRTVVDGRLCILNLLIISEYPKPYQQPIPSPFDCYRCLD